MKLLSPDSAKEKIRKENDELLEENVMRRKSLGKINTLLNTAKEDYEPEKVKALKEFSFFIKDLEQKKSKKLAELAAVDRLIEERKELYYGLVEKQDALEDRIIKLNQREKTLDLREDFIKTLESKWTGK